LQKIIEEQQRLSETLKPNSSPLSKDEPEERPESLPERSLSNSGLFRSTRMICENYPKNNNPESDEEDLGFTSSGGPPPKKNRVMDISAIKREDKPGHTKTSGS
jgi:hypothetical protein